MDQQQQYHFRARLTEAIVKLCQMEAVYTNELRIEGTVCVVSDSGSVMVAHFAECVCNMQSVDNDSSLCASQQLTDGLSVDNSELMLPEIKMEHASPSDDISRFEAVCGDSSSFVDLCQRADTRVHDGDDISGGSLEADGADSLALLEALERKDYEKTIDNTHLLLKDNYMTDEQLVQQISGTDNKTPLKASCSNNARRSSIMQYFENVHMETSHGLYKYKCCLCHKMFKIRTSLYEHINSHTGKRRYACDHCGYRFVHHSSLHNHIHNKHLPTSQGKHMLHYLCNGCDRQFKFRSQFDRHLRSKPDHCIQASGQ